MTPLEYATRMCRCLKILVMVLKKEFLVSIQAIINLMNILVLVIRELVIQQILLAKEEQSK